MEFPAGPVGIGVIEHQAIDRMADVGYGDCGGAIISRNPPSTPSR